MKRYFENDDSNICYPEQYFQGLMKENGLPKMTVIEAIPQKSSETEFIWCSKVGEAGEKGKCGKMCDSYVPRNGKSGICKYQGRFFEYGEKVLLKSKNEIK